ncbi:C4-type Zn-finger protein [Rhizobium ruizarguesonis]
MIYLKFRNKIERIVDCTSCDGKGFTLHERGWIDTPFGRMATGYSMLCRRCTCGKIVTYPWTRGRSMTPLIPRS